MIFTAYGEDLHIKRRAILVREMPHDTEKPVVGNILDWDTVEDLGVKCIIYTFLYNMNSKLLIISPKKKYGVIWKQSIKGAPTLGWSLCLLCCMERCRHICNT